MDPENTYTWQRLNVGSACAEEGRGEVPCLLGGDRQTAQVLDTRHCPTVASLTSSSKGAIPGLRFGETCPSRSFELRMSISRLLAEDLLKGTIYGVAVVCSVIIRQGRSSTWNGRVNGLCQGRVVHLAF